MISYIIFGITYAFAAAMQPGPFQAFIISQTIRNGWKHTLPAAFAPLISDGPIIVIVLLLLSTVPTWLIYILQIAGGLLLLYVAYRAFVSYLNYNLEKEVVESKTENSLFKATLVNALNPGPWVGWSLIMGPLFIKGYEQSATYGVALIISFYTTMVLSLMGIIILFGLARNLGPKVTRVTLGISAIALAGFGIYQIWQGVILILQST
ncbi:MAG: LysE family transporter [Ignavibacterium sp.]|nr:MAG: LysE family transporter [Ignavibacterium sp.]